MTASDTARLMTLCADRLTAHPDTARRAAELALPATNTSDVHVASSGTSDPTYVEVIKRDNQLPTQHPFEDHDLAGERIERRLDGVYDRWVESTRWLDGIIGHPLPQMLRLTAVTIEREWTSPNHVPLLAKIDKHCRQLIAVIHLCNPIEQDAAENLVKESAKLARFTDCRACGAPIDRPENRKLGLYDQWCYRRIDMWKRANPGKAIDDYHAEFCAWIRHNIAIRMVGFDRPASIHSPIGRTMVPEGA